MTNDPTDVNSAIAARLLRPIVLQQPNLIAESAWLEHIPFAFWLVETMRPHHFVELGTHTGVSYCAFLQAAQSLALPLSATAVDTWAGDAHTGTYDIEIFEQLTDYHDARYSPGSRLLRSTFDEALNAFADGSLDLLHIDGLHTYAAVRHDFEAWHAKMSPQGLVLFHDTAEKRDDFGVWRLWEELAASYPSFAFEHGHGLGLVAVGSSPPEPMSWLATRSLAEATFIRTFFATIGAGYSAQLREIHLRQSHAEMRAALDRTIRTLDEERAAWNREHVSARETIEKGAAIIDEQARILADQAQVLADQGAWIRDQEARAHP